MAASAHPLPDDGSLESNGDAPEAASVTGAGAAAWLLRNAGKWSDLPPEIMELIDV